VLPDDLLGPDLPGARLVITGDIGSLDGLDKVARDAHALVIEGTYLDADGEMADSFGHMTVGRAARFCAQNGVGTLLITHVSRRYRERDLIQEARQIFPNSFIVRDFDRFVISKERPVLKIETRVDPVDIDLDAEEIIPEN
jgi:ribonuclease Z